MKTHLWMLPAVALGSSMSAGALASDATLSYGQLKTLLDSAERYGFNRYEKLDVDSEDNRFEIEGWRDDGWELDVSMALDDGTLMRESQRRSTTPDWSLTGDELQQALALAQNRGMQRFAELEVDSDGHIEIEGYNAQRHELDLDLHRDDLSTDNLDVSDLGNQGESG
ncbi:MULTISPECIES: hypothetical protein [Salinicola]|uniref:PepSY domain-containing protein n=1 Tax=Salinicola socius TaxID=404433 RepID=A0A1Q8STH0_9GAMM|nr:MULTISPECIES: hypothetical protein [Salinicola]OLO04706.1 hypothetical protein BTW07_07865 [Salinicola socius]